MAGAIVIVLVLLAIPVGLLMSGALASAVIGEAMFRNGRSTHEGSELLELDD